ncbi:hypothetical protein OIE63_39345 (plasmid) [Streptomyces sp. NBC_01795]|uniref:hypothetical protein n=1 Tax=unclassified Streptomyces TaxID=2593676 RepID=UPI002DDB0D0B|nr:MULTISPECIES: hypothetical protein [unclassified Streptomyces]WSA97581.1 hypothetical protein OIE63_39345 [Streptomyces sp. NBC_01795]WSB82171.1 hypothetical protein OHB04_41470 [Streptomyces sp. NBC_01775]WSS18142.1 hypothetical protein OG533_40550 [Streptomyces sp. NBC_01186]
MSEELEYQMEATERRVRDLDRRLDDLDSEHESLKTRFGYTDDLDYELRDIRSDIEQVDGRVDEIREELGGRVDTAEQAVARLTRHVRLLEGQIMAAGGAPAADLDTFTKDQRSLARTMQSGWNAAEFLLSDHSRGIHRARVERFRNTRARHQTAREEVVELTGTLAGTRYGTQDHTEAATQLRSAITTEATLRQGLARQEAEAQEASEALAADTTARADKQPAIAAGVRAEKRLTLALRGRLDDAVSSRSLLPAWFATVLGAAPPARGTERWMECATHVLLYRLTYGIDDQVVALGPAPSAAQPHRRQRYEKLREDLRRW